MARATAAVPGVITVARPPIIAAAVPGVIVAARPPIIAATGAPNSLAMAAGAATAVAAVIAAARRPVVVLTGPTTVVRPLVAATVT